MNRGSAAPSGVDQLIGERVHTAMWRARITQAQLAAAIGVDQGSVSKRLRGLTPWKVSDVVTAAELCGVTVEDLMPRHEELGHVSALTRGNVVAESRCTQARADGNSLVRAAQTWGKLRLIAARNDHAAAELVASLWAVGS